MMGLNYRNLSTHINAAENVLNVLSPKILKKVTKAFNHNIKKEQFVWTMFSAMQIFKDAISQNHFLDNSYVFNPVCDTSGRKMIK